MTNFEIIMMCLGGGGLLGILGMAFWVGHLFGSINQKFEAISQRLDSIEKEVSKIDDISQRLARMEGREDTSQKVMMELVKRQ